MYPADFPADAPPPLIDPTLLIALILAVIVLMAVAFAAGRMAERRLKLGDAANVPRIIHKEITKKAREAASAPSGSLFKAAEDLVAEIEKRLGPVIALGSPLGKTVGGLKKAIEGEKKPAPGHAAHGDGHATHGDAHGHGHAEAHADAHEEDEAAEEGHPLAELLVAEALIAPKIKVKMKNSPVTVATFNSSKTISKKKAGGGGHHPPPEPLDPSFAEHAWQIRKAIAVFSDYWSRTEMLGEIEKAQRVLLSTPEGK